MSKIWKFGSDIDTDQIVPGRYAPYMRPNDDVADAAFIEARPDFARSAVPGDIIVAGKNFGCGSSREYAPLALKRRQLDAIIAVSFARIFYRNAVNLGIPLYESVEIEQNVLDGEEAKIDVENQVLIVGNKQYPLKPLPPFAQKILSAGGIVPYIKAHGRFPED